MYRKTVALLMSLCLATGLAGCAGGTETAPSMEIEAEDDVRASEPADAGAGKTMKSAKATGKEEAEEKGVCITVTSHRIETEEICTPPEDDREPFPWGYVEYPSFAASKETAEEYPKLAAALEDLSDYYYGRALATLADESELASEWTSYDDAYFFTSNEMSWNATVERADERVVSILVTEESFFNGPHPNTDWYCHNFDTQTGEGFPLSDAVNDLSDLPEILLKNLTPIDDTYVFSDEEKGEMLTKLRDMVADGEICWTLDDDGFHAYFNAYALQFYAFGPIFADLPYKSWPNLLVKDYRLPESAATDAPIGERIVYEPMSEQEIVKWNAEDIAEYYEPYEGSEAPSPYVIERPEWEEGVYTAPGVYDPIGESLVTLTEVDRETGDSLDEAEWASRLGITLPETLTDESGSYSDGTYSYTVDASDPWSVILEVRDATYDYVIGSYDVTSFYDTPAIEGKSPPLALIYAKLADGKLYVEFDRGAGADANPTTGFIAAINAYTGDVLWRSEMERASARNFEVIDDQVICGYGHPGETCYLYILSSNSGEVLDHWKLKSAPKYLFATDEFATFRVLTENTAYRYELSFG